MLRFKSSLECLGLTHTDPDYYYFFIDMKVSWKKKNKQKKNNDNNNKNIERWWLDSETVINI